MELQRIQTRLMPRRKGLHEDGDESGGADSLPSPATARKCHQQPQSMVSPYTPQWHTTDRCGGDTPQLSGGDDASPRVTNLESRHHATQPDVVPQTEVNAFAGIQAVDAVTRDDVAAEIRAKLEQEMQSDAISAVVIQEEEEHVCTKRRVIALVSISLLAIAGIVSGVVIATRTNEETYLEENASIEGMSGGDRFGEDIAMSPDSSTLAAVARKGHYVQVFRQQRLGSWTQIGQTIPFDFDQDNYFPGRVALSRNGLILVVSRWNSEGSDQSLRVGMAQAYLYNLNINLWEEMGQPLTGSSQDDHFGYSVALSDKNYLTLAVGSRQGDAGGLNEAGYVRVFEYNGSSTQKDGRWVQIGSDITGTQARDQFGISVALANDGMRIAVGAVGGTSRRGIVRVYDFNGEWNQVGQSIEGDFEKDDAQVVAMSASGASLVIAANGDEANANHAGYKRTFVLEGCCLWKQVGVDLLGTSRKIALSSDALCFLIGMPNIQSETGGGTLLRWSEIDSEWKEIAVARGNTVGDNLGGSVAVSGNCTSFSLGASQNDVAQLPAGYVRVYQVDDGLLTP